MTGAMDGDHNTTLAVARVAAAEVLQVFANSAVCLASLQRIRLTGAGSC